MGGIERAGMRSVTIAVGVGRDYTFFVRAVRVTAVGLARGVRFA
jgi:hypothetical protein